MQVLAVVGYGKLAGIDHDAETQSQKSGRVITESEHDVDGGWPVRSAVRVVLEYLL